MNLNNTPTALVVDSRAQKRAQTVITRGSVFKEAPRILLFRPATGTLKI